MNLVIITGNMTRDPETKTINTAEGPVLVCNFSVAVNRRKQGETDFFSCTAWRGLAEIVGKYARKGKKVAVTGELRTRSYEKDGSKRYAFEVEADEVEFLSPRETTDEAPAPKQDDKHFFTPVEDYGDMPF